MKTFLIALYLLFEISLSAIEPEKIDSVYWPMQVRLPISGTFAEFRNSHLHMGCDYKTYGINGFSVLSVFDGNIASMSYSANGYGLSLNLFSPSLKIYAKYGHLNDLSGDVYGLEELKNALLLLGKPEGFQVKLKPDFFKVKSKDRIARSGETGSGVSHLHLELFDGKEYFNPLSFINYKQEDKNPPVIQSLFIDSDNGFSKNFPAISITKNTYSFTNPEEVKLSGKIKLKVAGFDRISSKNQNNVYAVKLKINELVVFERNFNRMTYKEASDKDSLYDMNKSSLSPAFYVYNLYDDKNSHSIDLNTVDEGKQMLAEVLLLDASGNESSLKFKFMTVKNENYVKTKPATKFSSEDEKLTLNFSKTSIIGDGGIKITRLDKIPSEVNLTNLIPSGDAYQITSYNFSWKGGADGVLSGNFPDKEEALYLYDTVLNRWVPIAGKKSTNSISFSFHRLGIISVMRDKSPPVINYPYLIYRHYNLPEIQDSTMIERFYHASDKGSGVSGRIEVLLEGSSYPYTFDRDRNFIKLEIPKTIRSIKNPVLVQVRVSDNAGNKSNWFTDIIRF
ncbi:MAG TPA: hypothetical protein PK079_16490 [Leptospiraceae bacterium]|nr:hypothetical protein [Leptospiraceae bacterium]HMW05514.1 hypothetical protein [Leptospiraceae bacterium]HMX32459.1 hypothetical protein [Leptospiraceae bacterium]HMY31024.1 hypothetical protein [Leptospiraceae bacterium]HMZ65058.1 hypothetical protein [Leptospiraceae bacterium]